jgi:hypothetical protein
MTPPVGTRYQTDARAKDGGGLFGRWMRCPRTAITGRNRLSWGSDPESGLERRVRHKYETGRPVASLQSGRQMVRKRPPKPVHWRIEVGMRQKRDRRNSDLLGPLSTTPGTTNNVGSLTDAAAQNGLLAPSWIDTVQLAVPHCNTTLAAGLLQRRHIYICGW